MGTNANNQEIYGKIPVEDFIHYAEKSGLSNCVDLSQFYEKISKTSRVLDIGSGYGRVINGLLKREFGGHIVGLEQSPQFRSYLQREFRKPSIRNVEIIEEDINELKLDEQVDVALWLWSGICDFGPEEQRKVITKVANLLIDESRLYVEAPTIDSE